MFHACCAIAFKVLFVVEFCLQSHRRVSLHRRTEYCGTMFLCINVEHYYMAFFSSLILSFDGVADLEDWSDDGDATTVVAMFCWKLLIWIWWIFFVAERACGLYVVMLWRRIELWPPLWLLPCEVYTPSIIEAFLHLHFDAGEVKSQKSFTSWLVNKTSVTLSLQLVSVDVLW